MSGLRLEVSLYRGQHSNSELGVGWEFELPVMISPMLRAVHISSMMMEVRVSVYCLIMCSKPLGARDKDRLGSGTRERPFPLSL